jgi:hypothetical protein
VQLKHAAALAVVCALLCGCATAPKPNVDVPISWSAQDKRVVLVDPDVELSELTFGGVAEARADWTQSAKGYIDADIRSTLSAHSVNMVETGTIIDPHEAQLVKLHGVVGSAILLDVYIPLLKLPNKDNAEDWTLGPGVKELQEKYKGDYALFVRIRDSYSSGSRKMLQILAMGAGAYVPGGTQTGFASLVDLRTGRIVWFSLLASSTGDLRTEKPAADSVANLLKGLPL